MNIKPSKEVQEQAIKVAKATQKKGQNKEQTKLIAQGIEKGIAEYKKQQNKKLRERDRQRKQLLKKQQTFAPESISEITDSKTVKFSNILPWFLLIISWLAFAFYLY